MLLSGTDSMVPRAVEPLFDMGCGGNPSIELLNHQQKVTLRSELDAGAAMD